MINVLSMLENSAQRTPGKTAVIEGESSLSYSQLCEKSRRIGTALAGLVSMRAPVGVFMEKGINALCSFFGIVYAGGFYSMYNTELPDKRLQQIQSVSGAGVIITVPELMERAEQLFPQARLFTIDELLREEYDEELLCGIRARMIDTDPLYLNFTSGSTGTPKGIAVAHRSVIDFIGCFTDIFSITEEDIIANQAPFDFDVSVKDIYSAMYKGATLVIVPRQLFSRPVELIELLCERRVTTMIWAVSALCLVSAFHALDYKIPQTVNKVLFSGEVMPYKHLCEWRSKLPGAMLVNLYGPTEITCNCTYHILEKDRDYSEYIPIGRPFPNEDVFLLDSENRRITEKGIKGMIVVRGTALALGYYGMAEKTNECFVQDPLNSSYPERVYLTGDLGMYDDNGELRFCGRTDNQIKYMGHRIELEEVERAMSAIDGVERCICVFDEPKQRLKGYYVGTIDKNELYSVMKKSMPAFMIPGYLRQIEQVCLSKNGKLDRKKTIEMIGGVKGAKGDK